MIAFAQLMKDWGGENSSLSFVNDTRTMWSNSISVLFFGSTQTYFASFFLISTLLNCLKKKQLIETGFRWDSPATIVG